MEYKRGSSALALLIGIVVFIVLNAILGLFTPICISLPPTSTCFTLQQMQGLMQAFMLSEGYTPGSSPSTGFMPTAPPTTLSGAPMLQYDLTLFSALAGSSLIALTPLFLPGSLGIAISPLGIILAIIPPIIAGSLAGIIGRGSAGNGFKLGASSVLLGYYASLVIFFIYSLVSFGSLMSGGLTSDILLPLFGVILMIPIILAIVGGVGGAILSAILATPASSQPQQPQIVVQQVQPLQPVQPKPPASPSQSSPLPQQASTVPPSPTPTPQKTPKPRSTKTAKIICPACGAENPPTNTFCDSCGTRLKS